MNDTPLLFCKKCGNRIYLDYANYQHGELVIICSMCEAENILAPAVIGKVMLSNWFEVIGYRD